MKTQTTRPGVADPAAPRLLVKTQKSRGIYIALAVFFGMLGVHNFYAGYIGRAFTQIALVICAGIVAIKAPPVALGFLGMLLFWIVAEIASEKEDAAGDPLG